MRTAPSVCLLLAFTSYLALPSQGVEHPVTSVSNSDVEKAYLAYCAAGSDPQAAALKFQAGKHTYELDFKGTSWSSLVA